MSAPPRRSDSFRPAWWLAGPHLQTVVPAFLPASGHHGSGEHLQVEVGPGTRIRLEVSRPGGRGRGTVILFHGLLGSAESGYMRRTADLAVKQGWIAVRANLRNCGGTEALSQTLYNAGQSGDVGRILEDLEKAGYPRPFGLVGFSLGGNLVLRYAGLAGAECLSQAVAGVSPPVDLEATVASLESRGNFLYHAYFTRGLCAQVRRIRKVRPVGGPAANPLRIRSVRAFDSLFTAPDGGYASAEDYYRLASSAPHLSSLRIPSLILSALDDPIVPQAIFAPWHHHPPERIRFLHPRHGGHVGFWRTAPPRFWAAIEVLDFLEEAGCGR